MELETILITIFTVCTIRFYYVILTEKRNEWKNNFNSKRR